MKRYREIQKINKKKKHLRDEAKKQGGSKNKIKKVKMPSNARIDSKNSTNSNQHLTPQGVSTFDDNKSHFSQKS